MMAVGGGQLQCSDRGCTPCHHTGRHTILPHWSDNAAHRTGIWYWQCSASPANGAEQLNQREQDEYRPGCQAHNDVGGPAHGWTTTALTGTRQALATPEDIIAHGGRCGSLQITPRGNQHGDAEYREDAGAERPSQLSAAGEHHQCDE